MKKKQRRKQLDILRRNLSYYQLKLIKTGVHFGIFDDGHGCLFSHLLGSYTSSASNKLREGLEIDPTLGYSCLEQSWIAEGNRINKDLKYLTRDITI